MRRMLIVGTTLLVGCFSGFVAREVVAPARAQGQVAPPYEYDAVTVMNNVSNDKEVLVKYGREGWRLVAATQNGPFRNLYFERTTHSL